MVLFFVFIVCSSMSVNAQPKFDFDFSFNKFQLKNGERLTMTPKINYSKSPEGASFVKVRYYMDDNLITTNEQYPFNLDYKLNLLPGKHTLKVAIYATGKNLPTYGPFNFEYAITIYGTVDNNPIINKKLQKKHMNWGINIISPRSINRHYIGVELQQSKDIQRLRICLLPCIILDMGPTKI